ncbi:MAG: hypothetical protein LBI42_00230 [Chitinispirillales bacterium]|jgi:uncharacterized membrane-anchored protein YhcB (DUF1043 family)|nr:hypothetical protein [Chitinispirillales bacterium]
MMEKTVLFWLIQSLIVLFGIAIGHSYLLLRLRREENRRRELEIMLMEKRTEVLKQGKMVAKDLEEALYKAKVQQEIDDIIRKDQA